MRQISNADVAERAVLCAALALAACAERAGSGPAARTDSGNAAVELRDGFEGEALAGFWLPGDHGSGRYDPGAVELSREAAKSGASSARITVREGDVPQRGDSGQENERAELDSGEHRWLGEHAWCAFSFLVPEDFPIVDTRLVLSQWKQADLEGSPIVAQRFRGGRHTVTIRDLATRGSWRVERELPPIVPGRWHDMVFHVVFAAGEEGLVEVWMDGALALESRGPTASPRGADRFYHKLGLYRDRMREPMTIYVDDYALGSEPEVLGPAAESVNRPRNRRRR